MIILRTIFGSSLYGTTTPNSDIDYKSIYIPDARDILLQKIKGSISTKRSKGEGEKNYAGEVEEESYSLDKFLKLVSEGQTVSLDVLFSNPESWIVSGSIWHELRNNTNKLLTKNSKAFIGYCRQQSAKYGIKGSRVAAARDTMNFLESAMRDSATAPSVRKLGDIGTNVYAFVKDREFVDIVDVELKNGQTIRHLEVCGRKLPYTASIKNAYTIVKALFDEYGTRALLAETNEGIDWKALSHAVRIGEEAIELFETHKIVFPRWNAVYLRDIKLGKFPYNQVAERIEDLFVKVEEASAKSDLPEKVDQKWIDNFICRVYGDEVIRCS
jgi:RNA repair pathway DNA polymerase beta family protein